MTTTCGSLGQSVQAFKENGSRAILIFNSARYARRFHNARVDPERMPVVVR